MSILLWLMLQGAAVTLMLAFENTSKTGLLLTALALVVISAATFVSFIFLSIKRLHDMGFPGALRVAALRPDHQFLRVRRLPLLAICPAERFRRIPQSPEMTTVFP